MSAHFTPQQFQEYVGAALASGDPHDVQATLREAMTQRFPPLAAISADSYPVPANVALFLYGTAPHEHGGLLRASLGSPQTEHFWERLAAIASYVCAAADWRTLGELAFALDCALAEVGIAEQELADETPAKTGRQRSPDQTSKVSPQRLVQVWTEYFQELARRRAVWFVHIGIGYSQAFPAGLAVSPDLVRGTGDPAPPDNQNWPLLRLFWQKHHAAWKAYPEGVSQLEACPNPLLADLAERIRRSPDVPERFDEISEGVPEPFAELASDEVHRIAPPPLARPPQPRPARKPRRRGWWDMLWLPFGQWLRSLTGSKERK
jgi:hypothetical protein